MKNSQSNPKKSVYIFVNQTIDLPLQPEKKFSII